MQKQQIEFTSPAWLHSSGWDPSLHTVLIVHGYGGATQDYLPAPVLRDGEYTAYSIVITITTTVFTTLSLYHIMLVAVRVSVLLRVGNKITESLSAVYYMKYIRGISSQRYTIDVH